MRQIIDNATLVEYDMPRNSTIVAKKTATGNDISNAQITSSQIILLIIKAIVLVRRLKLYERLSPWYTARQSGQPIPIKQDKKQ